MHPQPRRTALPRLLAALAVAACAAASAQKIDDVPPAVQNGVAPNFMFMIDNSGSMSNIVPAAPFDPSTTYLAACPATQQVPAGTSVDIKVVSGVPKFTYGGTTYRHTTSTAGSEPVRCFVNTATYSGRLLADSGTTTRTPGSYSDSDYSGNYLNWYFGNYAAPMTGWTTRKPVSTGGSVQTRTEIAKASAKKAMDQLPIGTAGHPAVRVGLSTYLYPGNPNGGGRLVSAMADFDTAAQASLKTAIDNLTGGGYTPLATTLTDIARYLSTGYNGSVATARTPSVNIDTLLKIDGTDNSQRNSCLSGAPACNSTSSPKPIQYWCQRSSIFAVTDGRPNGDRSFNNNTYIRDYDGDCTGVNASACVSSGASGSWDRKTARTYEQYGSDYMDDVAKLLFDVDWRPDLTAPAGKTKKNNISTYMIGFADPAVQNDPLLINTARQGGGKFIAAADDKALDAAFTDVITDAMAKDAAAAAVAVTNAQITSGSIGYASSYNSGSWYGDLEAYSLDTSSGLQNGPTQWSARDRLDAQGASSRKIVTWGGSAGVPFTTANGSNFRASTPGLADTLINYTRGDRSLEGTTYRARAHLLGDIINAEPVVVNYGSQPVVYQAANDGMLHVIDGRVDALVATRGQELWAYVPRLVHPLLAGRADPLFQHAFLVDGTPATSEMSGSGAGSIGRLLVGGLAKGGAGYYALDITSVTANTEAAAAGKVLWEARPANMGYSFGTPLIVNTSAGWRVVVASGYRNDTATGGLGGDGRGHVWVLDPTNGNVVKEFITPSGFGSSAAGLGIAHLAAASATSGSSTVRYVWGGDLSGNIWRFDLDAGSGSAPVRIAVLKDPSGATQPVTVPPVVMPLAGSATKYTLYLGTGQYLSVDDVPGTATPNASANQVQTLYGILDDVSVASPTLPNIRNSNPSACPSGGGNGDFACQSATLTAGSYVVSHNSVDFSSRRGYYLDIPIAGGRVNTQAAVTSGGTLVVVVNDPTNVVCNPGGSSYLFQLSASTGGAVPKNYAATDYYDAIFALADALSSRPVLVRTSSGSRGLFRLSDKTTQSRQIDEPAGTAPGFRRIYVRPLN